MNEIRYVRDSAGKLLAMFVCGSRSGTGPNGEGVEFFTLPECAIQVGWMRREVGYVVAAHRHKEVKRVTEQTCEVLIVVKGRMVVRIGEDEFQGMGPGDVAILLEGTHSMRVVGDEPCEFWEVRNGPYLGRENEKEEVC